MEKVLEDYKLDANGDYYIYKNDFLPAVAIPVEVVEGLSRFHEEYEQRRKIIIDKLPNLFENSKALRHDREVTFVYDEKSYGHDCVTKHMVVISGQEVDNCPHVIESDLFSSSCLYYVVSYRQICLYKEEGGQKWITRENKNMPLFTVPRCTRWVTPEITEQLLLSLLPRMSYYEEVCWFWEFIKDTELECCDFDPQDLFYDKNNKWIWDVSKCQRATYQPK